MRTRGCYRTLRSSPWLADLAALLARGLGNVACARELSRRHPPPAFTPRQVRYWRWRLLALDDPLDTPTLAELAALRVTLYQAKKGWLHLLPREQRRDRDGHNGFGPGFYLRPREVDILCLLRDVGPLSALQLARLLRLSAPTPRRASASWLDGLCAAGLIAPKDPPRRPAVYALTREALLADDECTDAHHCAS